MSDVEKLIDMLDDSACRCHEAYRSRRMTDPNCNHDDAESWRELREGVSELRRQLAEAEAEIAGLRKSYDIAHEQAMSNGQARMEAMARAEAAEAKLALAEQDARRYRWLRDMAGETSFGPCIYGGHLSHDSGMNLFTGDAADTAIDAAIAAGEGES